MQINNKIYCCYSGVRYKISFANTHTNTDTKHYTHTLTRRAISHDVKLLRYLPQYFFLKGKFFFFVSFYRLNWPFRTESNKNIQKIPLGGLTLAHTLSFNRLLFFFASFSLNLRHWKFIRKHILFDFWEKTFCAKLFLTKILPVGNNRHTIKKENFSR